jgi:ketosteroid isomerase-like protein
MSLSVEQRLRRMEDRESLRTLVTRYGLAIDGRDMAVLADLFTRDAILDSADGTVRAVGREAIVAFYRERFAVLGPTFHFTHDHLVTLDPHNEDAAEGIITAHSESVLDGVPLWAALRYLDRYRRVEGAWQFAHRRLSFFYFLPVSEYLTSMGERLRKRVGAEPRAADWPEATSSWAAFYRDP